MRNVQQQVIWLSFWSSPFLPHVLWPCRLKVRRGAQPCGGQKGRQSSVSPEHPSLWRTASAPLWGLVSGSCMLSGRDAAAQSYRPCVGLELTRSSNLVYMRKANWIVYLVCPEKCKNNKSVICGGKVSCPSSRTLIPTLRAGVMPLLIVFLRCSVQKCAYMALPSSPTPLIYFLL